jgi:hypothetical protein
MARLWEDTLVIALRDAQWLQAMRHVQGQCHPNPIYPQTFVKLDGNAERDMGDVFYEADSRFFLLEVKPTRTEIKDEWVKRGKFKPKHAYRTLKAITKQWIHNGANMIGSSDNHTWMERSLRAHHFVWWDDAQNYPNHLDNIRIQPYISAAIELRTTHAPTRTRTFPPHRHGFDVGEDGGTVVWGDRTGTLPLIHSKEGCVAALVMVRLTAQGEPQLVAYWKRPLGLTQPEFQAYVDMLCQGSKNLDIHAIVLSNCGRFMRVVTSISQLKNVFERRPAESSTPQPLPVNEVRFSSRYAPDPPVTPGGSAPKRRTAPK